MNDKNTPKSGFFQYRSKKNGQSYFLYQRVQYVGGVGLVAVYFFGSAFDSDAMTGLLSKYFVEENKNTGLPVVAKGGPLCPILRAVGFVCMPGFLSALARWKARH